MYIILKRGGNLTGEILKEERERQGIDLRDVAKALKIRYDYLLAIERSEFDKLPGEVFTKGYIRAYARYLNIDPKPLIEELNNLYREKKNPLSELNPEFIEKGVKKKGRTLQYITGIIIFFVLISLLKLIENNHRETVIIKKEERSSPQKSEGKKDLTASQKMNEGMLQPVTQNQEYTIRFIASELTWILLETDNEKKDFILRPGESYEYRLKNRARIVLGNAGGVKMMVNGVERPFEAKSGEVKILNLP